MRREPRAAELAHLIARHVGARHDGRGDHFAARPGRLAVGLRLLYAVDLQQHLFDLARVDLAAGDVDQVAGAADENDLAVVADLGEIVGDEEAGLERLERCGVVEIAEGDVLAADDQA